MLPRWKLTDLALSELRALADAGVRPTPQDVLDIQALSLAALDSDGDDLALSTGTPVHAGGSWFYPPTVAAAAFVAAVAPLAFGDTALETHVHGFASCKGSDPDAMRLRGREAIAAVRAWAARLTCTVERETEAILSHYAANPPAVHSADEDDAEADAIESLARTAFCSLGGDLRAYEYQMSIPCVIDLLRRHTRLASAAGGSHSEARVQELRALALKCEEIRARELDNG